jgi:hypothetical protein
LIGVATLQAHNSEGLEEDYLLLSERCTVFVLEQKLTLEDVSLGFTPLHALTLLHACDQCHFPRVHTFSYRYHRKLCPNTEGETLVRTNVRIKADVDHQLSQKAAELDALAGQVVALQYAKTKHAAKHAETEKLKAQLALMEANKQTIVEERDAALKAAAAQQRTLDALIASATNGTTVVDGSGATNTLLKELQRMVNQNRALADAHARCAFFDRNLNSRMPLVPTPARLKRTRV